MRQSLNSVKVVGTIKSKVVKEGTTKYGDPYISMDLVVVSKVEDKIMENKISFWAKRSSKLASGYLTAADEYKTIENDGEENATRVIIDGNYEVNEYMSNGEFKSFPRIKGVFINRINEGQTNRDGSEIIDAVELQLECVIMNIVPEMKDGLMTGRLQTKLYSVGYNDVINEFDGVLVDKEIAEDFKRLFPINTTAKLNIKINNYVIVKEQQQQVESPIGFGRQLSNITESSVIKDYINETLIIGGDMPIIDGKYTNEEIKNMVKIRELAINEKMSIPSVPSPQETGFGSGFGTQPQPQQDNSLPF